MLKIIIQRHVRLKQTLLQMALVIIELQYYWRHKEHRCNISLLSRLGNTINRKQYKFTLGKMIFFSLIHSQNMYKIYVPL